MVKGIDVLLLRSAPSELHSMVLCFLLLFKWRDWVLHSWIEVGGVRLDLQQEPMDRDRVAATSVKRFRPQ